MSEIWSYRLSDFLLFSPEIYFGLFAMLNRALWPWTPLFAAAGLVTLWLLARATPRGERALHLLFAAAWASSAWFFHWQFYATINWAAPWLAAAFAGEAVLLVAAAIFRLTPTPIAWPRLLPLAAVLVLMPLAGIAAGRQWSEIAVFGLDPDVTAAATLAVLLLRPGRRNLVLLPMPLLWCALSAATHLAMERAEAWWMMAIGALALLVALRQAFPRRPAQLGS